MADTLHLKNGRQLDGLIVSETDTHLTVKVGVAEMKISKKKISSVDRDDEATRSAMTDQWKRTYFTHDQHTPDALRDLAKDLRSLEQHRRNASQAWSTAMRSNENTPKLEKRVRQLEDEYVRVNTRLADMHPSDEPTEYNNVVARSNTLQAQLVVAHDRLKNNNEKAKVSLEHVAGYMQAYVQLEQQLHTRRDRFKQSGKNNSPHEAWFELAEQKLIELRSDFYDLNIPYERSGASIVVEATINGEGSANLIFDTGASLVSLSSNLASRLNIEIPDVPPIELGLADGSTVKGAPVLLESLEVGEAKVNNVAAVVVGEQLAPDIDGLLGMTYLRHFAVSFSPADRQLRLKRFQPK